MISVRVTEPSQVAEARRRATDVARTLGFAETTTGRVAIAASELATNLVKYGAAGELLVGSFEDETGAGVELLALDVGRGLDAREALRDGYSTGGSSGTGLGAVRRQSQAFDLVSWPGRGTAVLARIGAASANGSGPPLFASVDVPLRGEEVNGDAVSVSVRGRGWTALVADGLGHGPSAAQASQEAVRLFRQAEGERPGQGPGEVLATIHAGLRHTRGGAVSIARYVPERDALVFAGIGNVAGAVVTAGETKRMVSLAGTAGHVARQIREFDYPFPPGSLVVLHSDGVGTAWSLGSYPGLTGAHPSLIAAVLYRDFARARDDATVLVGRGGGA